jgi:hypothetical protein
MSIKLTPRMTDWIVVNGVHIALATKKGFPTVIVSESIEVNEDTIKVDLTPSQIHQIENIIVKNPLAAVAPGQLGSVRAPYQFKGTAKVIENNLEIKVEEIYCTKPGAEAGIRLDTLGYEEMKAYEESRWTDFAPRA